MVFAVRLDPQHPEVTSGNVVADSPPMLLTESKRAIDTASAVQTRQARGVSPGNMDFS